jgi:hypothetical protein
MVKTSIAFAGAAFCYAFGVLYAICIVAWERYGFSFLHSFWIPCRGLCWRIFVILVAADTVRLHRNTATMGRSLISLLFIVFSLLVALSTTLAARSTSLFDAAGLIVKVAHTKSGVLTLSKASNLHLLDEFDGKSKWHSYLAFEEHNASALLVRDGVAYTALLLPNGNISLNTNRLSDGAKVWSKVIDLPSREITIQNRKLEAVLSNDGLLEVVTGGYHVTLSLDKSITIHDVIQPLELESNSLSLFEMAAGFQDDGVPFSFLCTNLECSTIYEVSIKNNKVISATSSGQQGLASACNSFPYFSKNGDAHLICVDATASSSSSMEFRVDQLSASAKLVKTSTSRLDIANAGECNVDLIQALHSHGDPSEIHVVLNCNAQSHLVTLRLDGEEVLAVQESSCKNCNVFPVAKKSESSSFRSETKKIIELPRSLVASDSNGPDATFFGEVAVLTTNSGKIIAWNTAKSKVSWGRDEGLSLIKHTFPTSSELLSSSDQVSASEVG